MALWLKDWVINESLGGRDCRAVVLGSFHRTLMSQCTDHHNLAFPDQLGRNSAPSGRPLALFLALAQKRAKMKKLFPNYSFLLSCFIMFSSAVVKLIRLIHFALPYGIGFGGQHQEGFNR